MWDKIKGFVISAAVSGGITWLVLVSFPAITDLLASREGIGILPGILVGIAWIYIGIAIHELGHLVMGKATGYKFISFQVGPLYWSREEDGKIRFRIWKISYAAGQCLMEPTEDEAGFKYFWYNFGGGLFNLILLAICWLLMHVELSAFWGAFFFIGILTNALLFITNLAPQPWIHNDGYNIYSASKSSEAKISVQKNLLMVSALKQGKRYRDFSETAFHVPETADSSNFWVGSQILLEYARLEDSGNLEAALKELGRLNPEKLPLMLKGQTKVEWLYHYLTREPNLEKAQELYKCKSVKRLITMEVPGTARLQAAYAHFVLNDSQKSGKFLKQAWKQTEKLPYKGWQEMEFEALQRLEKLLNN